MDAVTGLPVVARTKTLTQILRQACDVMREEGEKMATRVSNGRDVLCSSAQAHQGGREIRLPRTEGKRQQVGRGTNSPRGIEQYCVVDVQTLRTSQESI